MGSKTLYIPVYFVSFNPDFTYMYVLDSLPYAPNQLPASGSCLADCLVTEQVKHTLQENTILHQF